jgi:hypothetical protein
MSIYGVNQSTQPTTAYKANEYTNTTQGKNNGGSQAVSTDLISDILDLSAGKDQAQSKIYSQDTAKINFLKQVAENNASKLRSMVEKLLGNQSQVGNSLLNTSESYFSYRLDVSFMDDAGNTHEFWLQYEKWDFSAEAIQNNGGFIDIDQATRDEAASLIGEDGPFGVKQVTQNILDFAKALSGGDPSKIDLLKDAFIKGFDEVANMFGGRDKMPEISMQTYDAVMKGFAEWAGVDTEA